MTGGADLYGAAIDAPRKRGRPKGSTNKRPAELKGFIATRYGATAAQQSAALCMVTPPELKAAGGSMARAMVGKAEALVAHVRASQDRGNSELRDLVLDALRELAAEMGDADAKALRGLVQGFIGRVKEGTAGFGVVQALKLLADERAALLPYTDQRQPQAVELKGNALAPSVVLMGAAPATPYAGGVVENTEVFEGVFSEVSPAMSHDEDQAADVPALSLFPPTD